MHSIPHDRRRTTSRPSWTARRWAPPNGWRCTGPPHASGADLSVDDGQEPIAPPFSVADLDIPQAPEIVGAIREALEDGFVLGYSMPTPPGYLDAVTTWMRERHGWEIDPPGSAPPRASSPAFTIAIRTFTEPGDGIILPTPAYYPMFGSIERSGRRIVRSPLVERDGRWRLDLELLEEQAKDPRSTMLLFCSPHNPTGRVWERDELEAVARIAVDNDLLIVSDEIHFDLLQPGHEHTVLATLGEDVAARTIVLTSPPASRSTSPVSSSPTRSSPTGPSATASPPRCMPSLRQSRSGRRDRLRGRLHPGGRAVAR